jgi:hypothetical protein
MGQAWSSGSHLRVLMVGPVPRIYGGISVVAGAILDSDLPNRCQLTYLAEGTRRGPLAKLCSALSALARLIGLLARGQVDLLHLHVGGGSSFYRHMLYLALGRLARKPVLLHWHVPGAGEAQDAGLAGGRSAGWLAGPSTGLRGFSSSRQPGPVPGGVVGKPDAGQRMVVLPNPVDCDLIRPPDDPPSAGQSGVVFGRFFPAQGRAQPVSGGPSRVATASGCSLCYCRRRAAGPMWRLRPSSWAPPSVFPASCAARTRCAGCKRPRCWRCPPTPRACR